MNEPKRWLVLSGACLMIFIATAAIGLKLLPTPHTETDYLVVGCAATLLSLVVVFAVLLRTWASRDTFYRRRAVSVEGNSPMSSVTEDMPPSKSQ